MNRKYNKPIKCPHCGEVISNGERKEFIRIEEAANILGMSKSHLYRLTSERKIEHYKPNNKICYFTQEQLDNYKSKKLNPVA